jgi:hypothetical protein
LIFVDCCTACHGLLAPGFSFGFASDNLAHFGEIDLRFVEQAVQANRSVMVSIGAKRPEAKGDIKARLTHGSIPFIKIAA